MPSSTRGNGAKSFSAFYVKKAIVFGIGVDLDVLGNTFNSYSPFSIKAYKEKKIMLIKCNMLTLHTEKCNSEILLGRSFLFLFRKVNMGTFSPENHSLSPPLRTGLGWESGKEKEGTRRERRDSRGQSKPEGTGGKSLRKEECKQKATIGECKHRTDRPDLPLRRIT